MPVQTSPATNDALVEHVRMIHQLAAPFAGKGKLVVASFGEDPERTDPKTQKLGVRLGAKVKHIEVGDVDGMVATVRALERDKHRNVYMPLVVIKPDTREGAKGEERDILAVLGLVADFDDPSAHMWAGRMPVAPNYVLETSPGRFQCFVFFDRPLTAAEAKPLAQGLKAASQCDHGTADLSHVWRVPGCLNWPNAKKIAEGRAKEPVRVSVVQPWDGTLTSPDDLKGLGAPGGLNLVPAPKAEPNVSVDLIVRQLPKGLRAKITSPAEDRSNALYFVVSSLSERKHSADVIERIIAAHPDGVGAKYADRGDLRTEIERIIAKNAGKAKTNQQPKPSAEWRNKLKTTDRGVPLANLLNARTALENAPEWRGVLTYNEFSKTEMLIGAPPWAKAGVEWKPRELTDNDLRETASWLQERDINVSTDIANEALRVVAHQRPVHPVRHYLAGLKWDGKPRLDTWLMDHLGAVDTIINRAMGARWMIGAVARVMQPGCKLDTMLVLEGAQSLRKSSALKALGDPWFTDHMPDIGSKDAMIQLQGVWIVEHAELSSLNRADINKLKAFMTTAVDRFRAPHDKRAADHPRQCAFAGTTNDAAYLKDATGNRRYWCIACGVDKPAGWKIDVESLGAERSQLWAEARTRYEAGEPWWLDTQELEEAANEIAADRFEQDAWESLVRRHVYEYLDTSKGPLKTVWKKRAVPLNSLTVSEVLGQILNIEKAKWTRPDQTRVGSILTAMGWIRRKVSNPNGVREIRYFAPTT